MKKFLLFCSLILSVIYQSEGQSTDTIECSTPERDTTDFENLPWWGNNQYLEDLLDSLGYSSSSSISPNVVFSTSVVKYRVPIKFWIYRHSNGTGGPNENQLQSYMDNLNNAFHVNNNTLIGFYEKCDPTFINDDDHIVVTESEAFILASQHHALGCINIHIFQDFRSAIGEHIRARFFGVDAIFLHSITYIDDYYASTIAHEVGHFFELDHTHQYSNRGKCRKEAIDRNRKFPIFMFCPFAGAPTSKYICESSGDALRDTPADPNLNSNSSCNYVLTGLTDPWGDNYASPPVGSQSPDTHNFMSYNGDRPCRNEFSRLQIAVMLYSIERGKNDGNRSAWTNPKSIFDSYEPDNSSNIARTIELGEIQERNFHKQYIGNGNWQLCDEDWIRFVAPCSGSFNLETFHAFGSSDADTRITVFNASLTQLAQNDNISSSNHFSKINYNFISGQTYFIRIDNMDNNAGESFNRGYNISVGRLIISGPSTFCTSQTYTVNAPGGSTVNWTVSPSGIVNYTQNGNQITLTRLNNGSVTLTANTSGGCGVLSTNRSITIGPVKPGQISFPYVDPYIGRFRAEIDPVPGATSYNWYKNGTLVSNQHNASALIPTHRNDCGSVYDVGVEAISACGTSLQSHAQVDMGGDCNPRYTLSPNPAQTTITIVSDNENIDVESQKFDMKSSNTTLGIKSVKIYNASGKLAKQQLFSGSPEQVQMNISQLPNGIYFVEISDRHNKESQKLVIER